MAQIINHNAEDNPRLSEIYQILLLAGYFRIRIASLKAFDKIIGGIAWCITSSNFEIQVQYNDEMQIGQKIKVSEQICNALVNMKCPYTLQPFQLQGLDVNNIFPVVQWLVKFVYETRFQRQKYNREISVLLGKNVLKLENKGNVDKIQRSKLQRTRINKQISQIKYDHPIRVYSALLQYNDATALKMYHKLHNIITNKLEKQRQKQKSDKGKKEGKEKPQQDDFMTYLQNEDQNQQEADLNNFGQVGKFSLAKLQQIIQENKLQLIEAIKQHPQESFSQTQQIQRGSQETQSETMTPKQSADDKELRSLKLQNDKYQAQIKVLKNQLNNISLAEKQIQQEKVSLQGRRELVKANYDEVKAAYQQIEQIGAEINKELSSRGKASAKVEKLVDKKLKLKQKKAEIKKKAKVKLQQLEQKKATVEATIPQIDEQAFKNMLEEADMKKEIYDKKYEELTKVNQELAVLQRKAENYTSAAEIAQYHQRFIQLFELINCSIEEKRTIYSQTTNLEGIKKVISNYQQFLDNAKEGVVGARKKNDKKQLADNLKQILDGFEGNQKNAKVTLQKLKSNCDTSYNAYMDLVKQQREYLKILRNFKVEYQNFEKLYK